MNGVERIDALAAGGYSPDEVAAWSARKRQTLSDGGFSGAEINEFFGAPKIDVDSLKQDFRLELETLDAPPEREALTFIEAINAGRQASIAGMLARESAPKPESALTGKESTAIRIVSQATQFGMDFPLYVGGALLGAVPGGGFGSALTATAGAFALPAGIRAVLMETYENGNIESFDQFWDVFSSAMVETFKGYATGAAVATTGAIVGPAAPLLKFPAEVVTMVNVGARLEGRVAGPQEYLDAAILLGTVKASVGVAGKLRTNYVLTDKQPRDVLEDSKTDPTIIDDLNSTNIVVPRAYRQAAKNVEAAERTAAARQEGAKPKEEVPPSAEEAAVERGITETEAAIDRIRGKPLTSQEIAQRTTQERIAAEQEVVEAVERIERLSAEIEKVRPKIESIEEATAKAEAELAQRASMVELEKSLATAKKSLTERAALAPQTLERLSQALGNARRVLQPVGITEEGRRAVKSLDEKTPDGPVERVLERITFGDESPKFSFSVDEFYTNWFDKLHPLNQVVKAMREGRELPVVEDAYKLARLNVGVTGKASHFLEYSPFKFKTFERVGKPLREVLEPVKEDLRTFGAYVVSKRVVDLDKRGIKTGVDIEAAKATVKLLKKKMEPARADLEEYQLHVLTYLKDAEIISGDAFRAMVESNKDYVPFYREIEDAPRGLGKGLKVRDPIKEIKGSERRIHNPVESIIKNTHMYIALAERNEIGKALVKLAEKSPRGAEFATKAKAPARVTKLDPREIKSIIGKYTEGKSEATNDAALGKLLNEEFAIFRRGALSPNKNQIVVYRKGKKEVWNVDPEVAEVFNGMDAKAANALVKVLSLPASTLRVGAIWAPEFVARNPVRDQFSAYIFSENGYKMFVDGARGLFELSTRSDLYQDWLRSGGPMAAMASLDRRYLQKNIRQIMRQTNMIEKTRNVVKSPINALALMSEFSEQATRIGEFRRGVPKRKELRTKEQILRAGLASREVTLDFGRIGAHAITMNRIAAFFNAQVQGVDKIRRSFIEHRGRTLARTIGAISVPSVTLYLLNRDEEGFGELPNYQRDLFWPFTVVDSEGRARWFRLPKPFELGVIFGTGFERIAEWILNRDSKAFDGFMKTMFDGLTPNLVPTGVVPIIETFADRSIFRDSPLTPKTRERALPALHYQTYTTELTKALGRHISELPGLRFSKASSPIIIENFIRGWTGGLGTHFLNLADKALREFGVLPDPPRRDDTLADIVFIKAFAIRHPSGGSRSIVEFYKRFGEQQKIIDSIRLQKRDGEFAAAAKMIEIDGPNLIDVQFNREAITNLTSMVRMIDKNDGIPSDEKGQIMDFYYFQMIEIAKDGLAKLDRAQGLK